MWVVVNMENALFYQAQTDAYLRNNTVAICGNDYTATNRYPTRSLFVRPTSGNPDPRPVFIAINCVSNSPSHSYRQLMVKDFYNGGGAIDFSSQITSWRRLIDSVEAAPPTITHARYTNGNFEFTIPGQRGRTNRVEGTTDLLNWATLTNVFGTNSPIVIRDPDAVQNEHRAYRIVRP